MPANTRRLCELGVAAPLAREIATQITASTGNVRKLMEMSMPPQLAAVMAPAFTARTLSTANRNRAIEAGMPPQIAREMTTQVTV